MESKGEGGTLTFDFKRSDVLLAMVMCSIFLRDVPILSFREKVVMCVIIMKYLDLYIKSEADLIWVNNQIKKMEKENYKDDPVALCGSCSPQRDRSSDA
jgi:hypothetical protein